MRLFPLGAALALAFVATPALAANDGLACIDRGYSEAEQTVLDNFVATADLSSEQFDIDSIKIIFLLSDRIEACSQEQGWTEHQGDQAFLYKYSNLIAEAEAARHPKVVELHRRIREDIPDADRERFFSIMRTTVMGELDDEPTREPTEEEIAFLDDVLSSSAVDASGDEADWLGGYISAVMVAEDAAEKFSKPL